MGVTIAEAAEQLHTTKEAVRKRLLRGTLKGEKVAGEWTVYLDTVQDAGGTNVHDVSGDTEALRVEVAWLRARVESLEASLIAERDTHAEQVRRADTVLMSTLALVPRQLEDSQAQRPWWRRWRR